MKKVSISAGIGGNTSVNDLIKGKTAEIVKATIENELVGGLEDEAQEVIFNSKIDSLFFNQDESKGKYLNSIIRVWTDSTFKKVIFDWYRMKEGQA